MVNQDTILKVRNLVTSSSNGGRTNVDRVETDLGRNGLGTEWIQDSTGRVTDQSKDTVTASNDGNGFEEDGLVAHTEQEAVLNPRPVIEFSESEPYYPVVYSCAHTFLVPPQNEKEGEETTIPPLHDKRYGFFSPPSLKTEAERPLLNVTSVPITLQLLLPESVQGGASLTSDMVLEQNIEAMEWSLLTLVADTAGLRKKCNIDVQYNHRTLQRPQLQPQQQQSHSGLRRQRPVSELGDRSRHLQSLPYPTGIFEIATDRENTEWKGDCAMEYDPSEKSCFTLKTEMKIKYRGNEEESNLVEEYIQAIVRNQVSQDPSQLFVMDIVGLHSANESGPVLSGDLDVDVVGPSQEVNSTKPFDTPINHDESFATSFADRAMSPNVLIPVATGIVMLAVWFIFHRYSRRKTRQLTKTVSICEASKEQREWDTDIESGSVFTAPTISPTNSCSDSGTPDRKLITAPFAEDKPSGLLRDRPVRRSNPVSVDSPDRKALPVSVDSPDRSAAGLPPRPPRRTTIKLKRNRRKKKRKNKKVVPLKRVNSREGITEMPMISESDEDSELGSEGDSEYTSDDGSSIDASSGCLTPTRSSSLSLKSSRASSPQLSPRDELFANDAFAHDIEFVIEAPDFPNLLDNQEFRDQSDSYLPAAPVLTKRTLSDDKLAKRLTEELKKLEIEPRSQNESFIEDGDSPKRRLPLPWLK